MSEKIERFDFIGSIDHAEQHSRALLERVGLWESHGKHYRNGKSKRTGEKWDQCAQLPPLEDEFENTPLSLRHVGFQQKKQNPEINGTSAEVKNNKMSWDTIGHARGSSSKMNQYYTPELHQKVREKLYRADFQLWDLLDNKNGDWISGENILRNLLNS